MTLACTTRTESGEMARKASCSECCGGGGSLEAARGKTPAAEEEVAMTAGAEVRRTPPPPEDVEEAEAAPPWSSMTTRQERPPRRPCASGVKRGRSLSFFLPNMSGRRVDGVSMSRKVQNTDLDVS